MAIGAYGRWWRNQSTPPSPIERREVDTETPTPYELSGACETSSLALACSPTALHWYALLFVLCRPQFLGIGACLVTIFRVLGMLDCGRFLFGGVFASMSLVVSIDL
jgi:hypothetical protein